MELKNLIKKMGSQECILDTCEIDIGDILSERKYAKLNDYLSDNNIKTSNDLKRLSMSDYNKLKMGIPDIEKVGDERTELFIKKLDNIRLLDNSQYKKNVQLELPMNNGTEDVSVNKIGKIQSSKNWFIEINYIKYGNNNEYLDIRQEKIDGTRGKGISIKKELVPEFKRIINGIQDPIGKQIDNDLENIKKNLKYDENELTSFDMFESVMTSGNLKQLILNNEDKLYEKFSSVYGQNILFFKKKIEALSLDGDIVKFLNNPSILDIKKEQYDLIHENGMKTAIDIMNDYDKSNLSYTTVNELKIGDQVNTMTICAIVNNFNLMLGMYYNEKEDYIVLKSQTSGGEYNNRWLDEEKMLYYLQNEKEDKYRSLEFSHKPNQICRDIVLNVNFSTKVYLFDRNNKKGDYTFCGEFKPIKFSNNNRCIILEKIN